ncbi:MAG: RNase P subunit p30 family protein [Halobacteriota archaeon]
MYEAVWAYPDGDSTVSRHARTADRYGYDGIVVRSRASEYDAAAIGDRYGVDVVRGIEICADTPESASGSVGNFRSECTILAVRGGTNALNRFAVEQDRVDVLTRPMRTGGDFNHVLARAATDHGVRVEFDFGPVLRQTGGRRVQSLQGLRKLRELVDQYDTPYVVSATANSHLQLRAPRELRAIGAEIGFDPAAIEAGLTEWGRLSRRNRTRSAEAFIAPGVKLGKYEEDN